MSGALTNRDLLISLLAAAAAFVALLALLLPYVGPNPLAGRMKLAAQRRSELRAQQLEALQRRTRLRRDRPSLLKTLVERLKLRDLFAGAELRAKLVRANWRGPNAVAVFAFSRAAAPIVLGGGAALILFGGTGGYSFGVQLGLSFLAVVVGVYLPNIMMTNAIQKRQQAITRSFPDALDLLLICVESGLSIEAAFGRVAQEMAGPSIAIAEEFELTTAELAYLPERRQALENLVHRTDLDSVKAVCTSLIQAETYGTSISSALRVAAQESRDRRMAAAEKKAGALPAKLTVPMILFFLPVLFLVIIGPTVIQFMRR
jgi:tight adherence protein C